MSWEDDKGVNKFLESETGKKRLKEIMDFEEKTPEDIEYEMISVTFHNNLIKQLIAEIIQDLLDDDKSRMELIGEWAERKEARSK